MMQSNAAFEFDSVCLGAVGMTAAWRRARESLSKRYIPMLVISQTSTVDDGVYMPACDVMVNTVAGLVALREAINEALKYEAIDTP